MPLFIAFIIVLFIYWSPFEKYSVAYWKYCDDVFEDKYSYECKSKPQFIKTEYRANETNQTVMFKVGAHPLRLKGCAVWDGKNWSCDTDPNTVLFSDDGDVSEVLLDRENRLRQSVQKYHYWQGKVDSWLK